MTEFFFEYGLFAAKLATFVVAILAVVVVSVGATRRVKKSMNSRRIWAAVLIVCWVVGCAMVLARIRQV